MDIEAAQRVLDRLEDDNYERLESYDVGELTLFGQRERASDIQMIRMTLSEMQTLIEDLTADPDIDLAPYL